MSATVTERPVRRPAEDVTGPGHVAAMMLLGKHGSEVLVGGGMLVNLLWRAIAHAGRLPR